MHRLADALLAQEYFSQMQREIQRDGRFPDPDDTRYELLLEPWNTYQEPEARFYTFGSARREVCQTTLAEYDMFFPDNH